MLIACWSVKGGSGTTVVSCGLAVVLARNSSTLLADLCGDVPAALGLPEPGGSGLADWLTAGPDVPDDALSRLAIEAGANLRLIPSGTVAAASGVAPERGEALAEALRSASPTVVADCGRLTSSESLALAAASDLSLLVLQPCYLALRRALAAPLRPSGVILMSQPGRALTRRDVEAVLRVPVRAEVDHDPAVARAVDAGLLARRVPRSLERCLAGAA
ncbi:MAG: hypothetical protein ACRDV9_11150 [Acidimicrobiia bacterium]